MKVRGRQAANGNPIGFPQAGEMVHYYFDADSEWPDRECGMRRLVRQLEFSRVNRDTAWPQVGDSTEWEDLSRSECASTLGQPWDRLSLHI